MNSIWKDLLFLHGHLLHQDDLAWRRDIAPEQRTTEVASTPPKPTPTHGLKDCHGAACA